MRFYQPLREDSAFGEGCARIACDTPEIRETNLQNWLLGYRTIMRPMKNAMKRWAAVALVIVSTVAFSQDSISIAMQRMTTAKVFAFGAVGFAATTSEGEIDFKIVMSLPKEKAIAAFEKLYGTGNPQAKSYALAGLRKLDRTRFRELRTSLRSSDLKVQTESGCVISEQSLREVANDLDSGKYDKWAQ